MNTNLNYKILHKHFGIGTVVGVDDSFVCVDFPYEQNVIFQRKWFLDHCKIITKNEDDYSRSYQFPPLSYLSVNTETHDNAVDCVHSKQIIELLSTKNVTIQSPQL